MSNKDLKNLDLKEQVVKPVTKKKNVDLMQIFLIVVGVGCIGIALCGLFDVYLGYKKGADVYSKVESEYVVVPSKDVEKVEDENIPWYELAEVDIAGLQAEYEDVKGWLFFENEKISYPLLQGKDNKQYLNHTYDGEWVKAGSIFMDYKASEDFSDVHTVIYGHNMKDLSMFGRLRYYRTKDDYYEDHMYFQIFTDTEILRYQIFSYDVVDTSSFIYDRSQFPATVLAEKMMTDVMGGSSYNFSDEDKIVTLSTCVEDDEERFVVNAVLIDRYERKDK